MATGESCNASAKGLSHYAGSASIILPATTWAFGERLGWTNSMVMRGVLSAADGGGAGTFLGATVRS